MRDRHQRENKANQSRSSTRVSEFMQILEVRNSRVKLSDRTSAGVERRALNCRVVPGIILALCLPFDKHGVLKY
jgi:hypothetical protein